MLLSGAVLLFIWYILSLITSNEVIIPSPGNVLKNIFFILKEKKSWLSMGSTFLRAALSLSLDLALALALGIAAGLIKPLYDFLKPLVLMLKSVPTMAIILLSLIWFNSETAPLFVGFLVIFPLLYSAVYQGIVHTDKDLLEMAEAYGVPRKNIIKKIYLPSVKSYLYGALTTAAGLNLKVIIASEVLSQPSLSIGNRLQIERINLNTAGVAAWAVIVILLASLFDRFLRRLSHDRN